MEKPSENGLAAIRRVVGVLEEDIVFGRLRPRERLIEEDLVARFDVKRHGIRRALVELEHMGMVIRIPGRGARVRDFTPQEIDHLYGLREMLEAEAARQIPLPPAQDYLSALETLCEEHSDAVDRSDLATAFRANIRFHTVMFSACGNPYLVEAIEYFAMKSHAIRSYSIANRALLELVRDEHRRMVDAIRMTDRETLVSLCLSHLKPSREAYLEANQAIVAVRQTERGKF